jgi:choline kinase
MSLRRAVILAAGNGKRMGRLTADRPKAMLDVGGRSLITRSLDALALVGIDDVTIVVGYEQQRMRDHLEDRVRFIENPRYQTTNSLYSLWLAREVLANGAVIMNADILVSSGLLRRLVFAPVDDAVLIDTSSSYGDEEMKVKTWQGFAVDFGKDLPPWEAHGENVGVLKFGPQGARRLVGHLDRLIAAGDVKAWAPAAFRALSHEWPLRVVTTDDLPWTEIDFPDDLARARQLIESTDRDEYGRAA